MVLGFLEQEFVCHRELSSGKLIQTIRLDHFTLIKTYIVVFLYLHYIVEYTNQKHFQAKT